ncbi:hypothetical protein SAMN05428966_12210 [Massilia sp. PDC64]|nr:hypothetical protein [Massilia sp. PDC64]SDF78602.1 hypothetical protein SAMN05428966_12210 [Massilia sp. PDC64]
MTASFRHLWGMPLLLGAVTVFGLVVGLLEDGAWDVVAAAALALPVLVGAWYAFRPARPVDPAR